MTSGIGSSLSRDCIQDNEWEKTFCKTQDESNLINVAIAEKTSLGEFLEPNQAFFFQLEVEESIYYCVGMKDHAGELSFSYNEQQSALIDLLQDKSAVFSLEALKQKWIISKDAGQLFDKEQFDKLLKNGECVFFTIWIEGKLFHYYIGKNTQGKFIWDYDPSQATLASRSFPSEPVSSRVLKQRQGVMDSAVALFKQRTSDLERNQCWYFQQTVDDERLFAFVGIDSTNQMVWDFATTETKRDKKAGAFENVRDQYDWKCLEKSFNEKKPFLRRLSEGECAYFEETILEEVFYCFAWVNSEGELVSDFTKDEPRRRRMTTALGLESVPLEFLEEVNKVLKNCCLETRLGNGTYYCFTTQSKGEPLFCYVLQDTEGKISYHYELSQEARHSVLASFQYKDLTNLVDERNAKDYCGRVGEAIRGCLHLGECFCFAIEMRTRRFFAYVSRDHEGLFRMDVANSEQERDTCISTYKKISSKNLKNRFVGTLARAKWEDESFAHLEKGCYQDFQASMGVIQLYCFVGKNLDGQVRWGYAHSEAERAAKKRQLNQ